MRDIVVCNPPPFLGSVVDLLAAEVAVLRKQREHAEALFEDMRNNFSQTLQQHDHTLRMLTEEHNNQMRELRQHIQTRPTATVPRPHTSSRPATGSYWWSNMPRHADPSSYARSTPGGSGPGGWWQRLALLDATSNRKTTKITNYAERLLQPVART